MKSVWYLVGMNLALLAVAFTDGKHALHIFQQNRYELFRYTSWLKKQKPDYEKIMVFFLKSLPWILLLVLPFRGILSIVLLVALVLIYAVIKFMQENKQHYIKPLHVTSRVKRQIVTLVILFVFVNTLVMALLPMKLHALLFMIAPLLCWGLIYPMFLINEPAENMVRNHYINDAKKILKSRPQLIKIGITGSYGKTSTKNIIQAVLSENYYSLMTPASFNTPLGITRTVREQLKPIHEVFVCEMGADKVGDIDYLTNFVHPKYGIVTSIGPQHLNTFGSLENIIHEKMLMVENLPQDGVGILNCDNAYIRDYKVKNPVKIIRCGINEADVDYRAVNIDFHPLGSTFDVVSKEGTYPFETSLLGAHNITNILLSVALGREMGISFEELQKSVRQIQKIEHRLELKKINGYTFIDDAFNANPEGSAMSLEVLSRMPNTRWIVTPGMIDLGAKEEEVNYHFGTLMKDRADRVILVGKKQTEPILRGLEDSGFDMEHVRVVDKVQEAFAIVYQNASTEDTILLENDLPDAFNK